MTVIDPKPPPEMTAERVLELYQKLRSAMGTWIFGLHKTHDLLAKAAFMLILYTDKITGMKMFGQPPIMLIGGTGIGKTDTFNALSMALRASHNRVQGVPSLRDNDFLGNYTIKEDVHGQRRIVFVPGKIYCHTLLVDESNRLNPKTESALLEGFEERSVTPPNEDIDFGEAGVQQRKILPLYPVSGDLNDLTGPRFFWPFLSQNPFGEEEGTYPTPQAVWDRLTLRIEMERPSFQDEMLISNSNLIGKKIEPVADLNEILAAAHFILQHVTYPDTSRAREYQNMLVRNTDPDPKLRGEKPNTAMAEFVAKYITPKKGASPRVHLHMNAAAIVWAFFAGAKTVEPEHIRAIAPYIIPHRLGLTDQAIYTDKRTQQDIFAEVLAATQIPKWKE